MEVRDNCKLGFGCNARAVVKNGKVTAIYIVTPGTGYVASDETLFVVDRVEVISGGTGYTPGFYDDEYGGSYQVIANDDGVVTEILPTNYVPIPARPNINIPRVTPSIPAGGRIDENGVVVDSAGNSLGVAKLSRGLNYRTILVPPPSAEQVAAGEISDNLTPRLLQTEVIQVVDCPD